MRQIVYPIPGRGRIMGSLTLPEDLTETEAARVCRIVMALPFDDETISEWRAKHAGYDAARAGEAYAI